MTKTEVIVSVETTRAMTSVMIMDVTSLTTETTEGVGGAFEIIAAGESSPCSPGCASCGVGLAEGEGGSRPLDCLCGVGITVEPKTIQASLLRRTRSSEGLQEIAWSTTSDVTKPGPTTVEVNSCKSGLSEKALRQLQLEYPSRPLYPSLAQTSINVYSTP